MRNKVRNSCTVLFLSFLFGCSSPSGNAEKEKAHCDSIQLANAEKLNPPQAPIFDTIPQPTEDLKKFLSEAKKIKFLPADTAHKFTASDHSNYFGVANMPNTFAGYERSAMKRAKNACLDLIKNNSTVHVKVEEWIFENEADAKQVDDALSAPLEDKRMERFARFPFTFWRVRERMYYVHTVNEQDRAEVDKVSNLLVNLLSPDQ